MNKIKHIHKDDFVKVICGDYKNQVGKVLKILNKKQLVVIENINIKTVIKSKRTENSIIKESFKVPFGIHVSNVMYFDNNSKLSSRIRYIYENNKKYRYIVKNEKIIKK